jgi:tetratricopeptide (TPR) repeat protein
MARALAKSSFVLLALGLWILACQASLAEDDDPKALNQQVNELIEQGKYQEAIPIAEKALEVASENARSVGKFPTSMFGHSRLRPGRPDVLKITVACR